MTYKDVTLSMSIRLPEYLCGQSHCLYCVSL